MFSQFVDYLRILRERLDSLGLSYQYLDGSMPADERARSVRAFQAGEGDFFPISLRTLAEGLFTGESFGESLSLEELAGLPKDEGQWA